jgi:hypothetical protein
MTEQLKLINVSFAVVLCVSTAGCGLRTPDMEISSDQNATLKVVNNIMSHVEDELGCAINQLIKEDKLDAESAHVPRAYPWLDKSTAQISLKLTVDEKSTLNAGLSYSDFFTNSISTIGKTIITTPRSFAFGANIGGSSDATRIDNSDYTFSVADAFVKDKDYEPTNGRACEASAKYDGVLFNSQLHIRDWLESRLAQFELHPEAKQAVPDTLTTDITFVVMYSGNITPTWHLVPVSYNTGGSPFFNAARTRTDDVIISIGSNKDKVTTAQNIQKQNSGFSTAITTASPPNQAN